MRLAPLLVLVSLFASAPAHAEQVEPPKQAVPPDPIQPPAVPKPAPDEKPKWEFAPYGYLRAGLDWVQKDDRYDFVGRNNGFILDGARVGLEVRNPSYGITVRISVEGASGELVTPNTPIGSLAVRLRDAYARWDPFPFLGVQLGQFKAPFQGEELRATDDLMFASRAVGVDGVLPGRGFQLPGLQLDRQLGVMISPVKPIGNETFGASYYLMVMNGNGTNQLLDDNGHLGIVGRVEAGIKDHALVGAGVVKNDRTVGTLPNLYNEDDVGLTGDIDVKYFGFEVYGAVTRFRTTFPTVGTAARVQLGWHAQAAYRIALPGFFIAPSYRYAFFDPWNDGGSTNFQNYGLHYHTVGIRAAHERLPLQAWINYTFTVEEAGRKLDDDRLEILGMVTF